MVGLLPGRGRRSRGAPLPRSHPPPRTVPAHRSPRRTIGVLPKYDLLRAVGTHEQRGLGHLQGPARLPQAPLRRRKHILRCERPRVAVHGYRKDTEARISLSANIRRSMRPPLPDRYLGNALVPLFAAGAVRDIASEALGSVAGRIRGAPSPGWTTSWCGPQWTTTS
uniref:Uncharacterized protein n=1 Tax=Arundo donax TaxID=35708 RepID=A0A0A9C4U6_ARUDO